MYLHIVLMSYLLLGVCDKGNDKFFGCYALDLLDPRPVRVNSVRRKDGEFHVSAVKLRNQGLVDGEFCS